MVTSCPGCGRTTSDLFQRLAAGTQEYLRSRMPDWRASCPGVENMTVAVMGCVVNGPGEAREADYGIAGGKDCGLLMRHGEVLGTYPYDALCDALIDLIKKDTEV